MFCLPNDEIGESIFVEGRYESELLKCLFDVLLKSVALEGASCLDVGANIGNHSMCFASRFKRVEAFEPNPICCLAMKATLLLNNGDNVVLNEFGLSDVDGYLPYALNRNSNLGASRFLGDEKRPHDWLLEVRNGDRVVSEKRIENIALIKIDVEQFEEKVLDGLSSTIEANKPVIVFESQGVEQTKRLLSRLQRVGYEHFYTCEYPRSNHTNAVVRILFRVWSGAKVRPAPLRTVTEREYLMLVASSKPLLEGERE